MESGDTLERGKISDEYAYRIAEHTYPVEESKTLTHISSNRAMIEKGDANLTTKGVKRYMTGKI
jgi:hypothetical protein